MIRLWGEFAIKQYLDKDPQQLSRYENKYGDQHTEVKTLSAADTV